MSEYDDIIDHERFEPLHHPRMSRTARAAQFSPFAALTGFDDSINTRSKQDIGNCQLDEKVLLEFEQQAAFYASQMERRWAEENNERPPKSEL